MKIISKNKDFYDHACQYSQEPLWIRKNLDITLDEYKKSDIGMDKEQTKYLIDSLDAVPFRHYKNYNHIDKYVFGYCGSLIPFYVIYNKYTGTNKAYIDTDKVIFDWNKLYSKEYNRKMVKSEPGGYFYMFRRYGFSNTGIKEWVREFGCNERLIDIFIKIGSPIFIIKKDTNSVLLSINPNLKQYNIQSFMNAYTVYQDTERYLSNDLVMCNQNMPDFGDILKRDAHGMDKWSFKTRKNTKKRKQK